MKLSNQPYKGCFDYLPKDFTKLKYIFDKWREVCIKCGFEEYLTPVLEYAEIYEAKSGEDIKKELYILTDNGGRRLALRPEMTPSVTRLVTQIYGGAPKPLKYFSIANFFRGERPQKGRYREFWQLNADIFGSESIYSDLEILQMALEIMLSFNAPKDSFKLRLNNRILIDYLLLELLGIDEVEKKNEVVRKMDKYKKLSAEEFIKGLIDINLNEKQIEILQNWMQYDLTKLQELYPEIASNDGFKQTVFLLDQLKSLGYEGFFEYSSELIRGFDYYDGMIFEVFDMNPEFQRSLFGGGRYNGLAELFGNQKIPAVGFAPGNPISLFLDNWNLWPDFEEVNNYYLPILAEEMVDDTLILAKYIRDSGKNVLVSDEVLTVGKGLAVANKLNYNNVIIYGPDEKSKKIYKLKNMLSGVEEEFSYDS